MSGIIFDCEEGKMNFAAIVWLALLIVHVGIYIYLEFQPIDEATRFHMLKQIIWTGVCIIMFTLAYKLG